MIFKNFRTLGLLKTHRNVICNGHFHQRERKPRWKVLFFGTDEFSIFSLRALCEEYRKGSLLQNLEVVTTINQKPNPVQTFSERENLSIHKWPPNLMYGHFDVGVVASFGHLIPQQIIEKFQYGMLNIHASLLPRWRGAAPIIYAIANGDTVTGITIMKIKSKKFDVGEIVTQRSVLIHPHVKMRDLFLQLGAVGATCLIETLSELPDKLRNAQPQPELGVTYAPKVTSDYAQIKWDTMTSKQIYNLERAVDGVFQLQTTWKGIPIKLINVALGEFSINSTFNPGFVDYDKQKKILKILCCDSKFITVEKVGVAGKKVVTAKDFNNGYVKKEPLECRYFK